MGMEEVNGDFESRLEHCKNLDGKKERSACLWSLVFDIEVFTDEVRRHMPCGTAIEPLASAAVERCVDVSRELAKGMKHNEVDVISWEYIDEKAGKLDRNIEDIKHDIKVFRMRDLPDRIEYP